MLFPQGALGYFSSSALWFFLIFQVALLLDNLKKDYPCASYILRTSLFAGLTDNGNDEHTSRVSDVDNLPYTTLSYATGPGYQGTPRKDLSRVNTGELTGYRGAPRKDLSHVNTGEWPGYQGAPRKDLSRVSSRRKVQKLRDQSQYISKKVRALQHWRWACGTCCKQYHMLFYIQMAVVSTAIFFLFSPSFSFFLEIKVQIYIYFHNKCQYINQFPPKP